MTDLEKILEFVEGRIKNNELRRIFNYEAFMEPVDYEARMEELQKIKDFIKELIDKKNQEGGDEE